MVGIAVVTIIARKKTQTRQGLWGLLHYCMQDKKTMYNGRKLVTGVNCVAQSAFNEMVNTKLQYRKPGGRQYYHIMQSFHPDEPITPETAHEIALRFAEENFPGYEVLVATHVDRHHVHSHFVVNSVNAETGLKFHSDNHEIQRLRDSSDKLCVEYGLSVVVPKSKKVKGMSTAEYHVAEKGQSWKLDLAMAIDEAMRYAVSKEHFIELMEMEGYEVKWKDTHKYITYTCPNGKPCRDIRLHEEKYLKENMEDEFRIREKIIRDIESTSEDELRESGADSALYRGAGEGLDSVDSDAEKPIRDAEYALGTDENTGDMERPLGYAGGATGAADSSRGADGTDSDGVSGDASSTGGADSDGDLDLDGELPVTGWESERELLTATLYGGTDGETQLEADSFGFAYPDYPDDHLGIGSAYLAADVMNILDNDSHTEDCTTQKQPPKNKKNTQSGSFDMSM